MPEDFVVPCTCGDAVPVFAIDSGTRKTCPTCSSEIKIPPLSVLRTMSGDTRPHASPIEKLVIAANNREPPFDGKCHGCKKSEADFANLFDIDILNERWKIGTQYYGTFSFGVSVSTFEENRYQFRIPLLLCESCQKQYRKSSLAGEVGQVLNWFCAFVLIGVLIVVILWLVTYVGKIGFWMIIPSGLVGAMFFKRNYNSGQLTWLKKIRWVDEALSGQDEFSVMELGTNSLKR